MHAIIDSNVNDPIVRERLLLDMTGDAPVERTPFTEGFKAIDEYEKIVRGYEYFIAKQDDWADEFRVRLIEEGIPEQKVDRFLTCFAQMWVDGNKRRQHSPEMMSIKAAIRDFDRTAHKRAAGRFVINQVADDIDPMFDFDEMSVIFRTNELLVETFIPGYLDFLGNNGPSSINNLYIRRGVHMPKVESFLRRELHYLSSYSFALTPVEQFAVTWTQETKEGGVSCIFSAPLPAVQKRIVAFAPFIKAMDLNQLELVVAPPIEEMPLTYNGEHGRIHEFSFR